MTTPIKKETTTTTGLIVAPIFVTSVRKLIILNYSREQLAWSMAPETEDQIN